MCIQRWSISWGVKVPGLLCSQDIHCSDIGTVRFNHILGPCFICQISCIVSCCCLATWRNGWPSGLDQYNQWPGRKWQMIFIKKDNAPVYGVFTVLHHVVLTLQDAHWSMRVHMIVMFLMHVSCVFILLVLQPTNAHTHIYHTPEQRSSNKGLYIQPPKHTAYMRYCNVTHTLL